MSNTESLSKPPRRRWFQYSLRTLLLFMVTCNILIIAGVQLWKWTHRTGVRGQVVVNGRPLTKGTIAFIALADVGKQPAIASVEMGGYELSGLRAGQYRVEIRSPQSTTAGTLETIPPQYNVNSELLVEVPRHEIMVDFSLDAQSVPPDYRLKIVYGLLMAYDCLFSTPELAMPDFRALESFKGRVAKVEEIEHQSCPHSASGPDFRVTVVTEDGATIIIARIHTQLLQEDLLKKLLDKEQCNLPEDIAQCEDPIGKDNY